MHTARYTFSPWLLLALLILLSGVALAACSTDQTQAAGSTPATPTATAMFRHPGGSTPGSGIVVPTLPIHAQNCGAISLLPNGKLADAGLAQTAGNCFWQAYQHCQLAGLFVQVGGIDTVTTHTLLITKG